MLTGSSGGETRPTSPEKSRPRLRQGAMETILRHLDLRRQGVLLVLIVLWLLFQVTTHGVFLNPRNIAQLLRQASVLGVAACGMTIIIILGEIDLSIGSALYLVGIFAAVLNVWYGWGVIPTLIATLLIGLGIGLWHGIWVARLGVPAFVVTLASLMGLRGIGLVISDAATIYPVAKPYQMISEGFLAPPLSYVLIGILYLGFIIFTIRGYRMARSFGVQTDMTWLTAQIVAVGILAAVFAWVTGSFKGIPTAVIVLFAVASAIVYLMNNTILGRNFYAIGSNRDAAALAGIDVRRHLVTAFLIMGAIYFASGTLQAARLSGSIAGLGQGLELDAIAATVIGGTSLMGGVGTVTGALAGALLLASVDNGMSLMNVSSFLQLVVKAGLLLAAVWFDVVTRRQAGD